MVPNITLWAIVMLYFPKNSLKINALDLSFCRMFILRHKGTKNSSSCQKIIIKKANLIADIFNTGIYQWIEQQQVMHSLRMNPVTYFQILNILLISEQPENARIFQINNFSCHATFGAVTDFNITITLFMYTSRDGKSQIMVLKLYELRSASVNIHATHLQSFREKWLVCS